MKLPALIAVLGLLAACDKTTQTTSGADYLSRHPVVAQPAGSTGGKADSIEDALRKVASVEPTLTFPARIGLARIDGGQLSAVPGNEAQMWKEVRNHLGPEFGEFVPLSLMVTEMAASSVVLTERQQHDTINKIRIGAARQHLDAVLVYESYSKTDTKSNMLSIGDLTIVGGYVLPSKTSETEAYSTAMLIDVMQGYPYGTASATIEKETAIGSRWGWGSDKDNERAAESRARAVGALAKKVEEMIRKLRSELEAKQANEMSR